MKDPWTELRQFTQARIALGATGSAWPTRVLLDFQMAHAEARDAVLRDWEPTAFKAQTESTLGPITLLNSQVVDRQQYLLRPDLGRRLAPQSQKILQDAPVKDRDVAIILSNGLSTTAVETHAQPLVKRLLEGLTLTGLSRTPLILVANGRVALSDEIGFLLRSRSTVLIIGERPGLSAADSLGIYLTLFPAPGKTDADRNCLSNIRVPEGLDYETAAAKTLYLLRKGFELGHGGVALKDDSPEGLRLTAPAPAPPPALPPGPPESPARRPLTDNRHDDPRPAAPYPECNPD